MLSKAVSAIFSIILYSLGLAESQSISVEAIACPARVRAIRQALTLIFLATYRASIVALTAMKPMCV